MRTPSHSIATLLILLLRFSASAYNFSWSPGYTAAPSSPVWLEYFKAVKGTDLVGTGDITTCTGPLKNVWGATFDDGPSPNTQVVLDYFANLSMRTTFWVIGANVVQYPDMVLKSFSAGHQIALHTWSHPDLTTLSQQQIVAELIYVAKAVFEVTGQFPKFFRPPYGAVNDQVREIAAMMGLRSVTWADDSQDWSYVGTGNMYKVAQAFQSWMDQGKSNEISLEHDYDVSPETVAVMAQSMDIIVKAGKRIVTLSQCIGEADPYNNAVLQGFFASGQFENRDKLMNVTTFPPNSSISTETTSSGSSMTTLTATYATNHLSLKSVIGTEKVASITGVRTGDVGIKSTPSRSSNASESSLQITSTALTGIIIGVVSAFLLALALLWMHLRSKRGHSRKRKHGLDSAVPLLSKRSLSFPDRPLNAMSLQPACVFDTPISQHPTQTPPRHCNPPDLSAQQNTFQQSQLSWHLFFPSLSQAQTGPWQSPSTFSSQCNQPHALSILSPFPPEQPVFQQQPRTPPAHEPTCSPPQPRIRTAIPLTSSPIPQPYAPIKRRFAQSPLIQQTTTRILSDHTESIDAFFFDFDYGDEQEAYDPAKRRINVSPSREY